MNHEKSYIAKAERWFGDTPTEQSAQVMATLAVAEQLKRIADALEDMNAAYAMAEFGTPPAPTIVPDMPRDEAGFRHVGEPDELAAERQDNRRRAREQMDGYRRGMGLDTDAESQARTDYADPLN